MTAAPDLPTRVSRNSEDIDALYKLLKKTDKRVTKIDRRVGEIAAVQQEHGARLERIEYTQVAHGEKLDSHGEKLDSHGEKLDSHGEKLDSHSAKLDAILELLRQDE